MEKLKNTGVKEQVLNIFKKHWLFLIAFALMAVYLKMSGPMNNWSGDAASIWTTIKSYHSDNVVSSYVLYKGFASVYPYVWFYDLSLWLGVGEFFFVKLYHCFLFAYIATIGFPYLMSKLLKIQPKTWRKCILLVILFVLWQPNQAFTQIMVDLPSLAYFLLAINSALKISDSKGKKRFGRYLYTGLLIGLNTCISGQYSVASLCVILFILIKTVPLHVLKEKAKRIGALACIIVMFFSMGAVRLCNTQFEKNVVDPLRAQGEWIPTGDTWLKIGFTRLLGVQRSGLGTQLPDNRGLAIVSDVYGEENYEQIHQDMVDGKVPLTMGEYFKLAAKYPMDFVTRYANRVFLALSPDGGALHFIPLFIAYSALFLAFLSIMKRCKSVKQFFSPNLLIILSFVFAIAALVVLNIEIRCLMQLQGLVLAAAILDDTLWDGLKGFGAQVRECWRKKSLRILGDKKFPYAFFIYCIFMVFCFMHIASIYEITGIDPSIVLFSW